MIIVDASVAVKWFIEEAHSDTATSLLNGSEKLIAPEIIQLEVASALTRLHRMGALSHPAAEELLEAWRTALQQQVVTLERASQPTQQRPPRSL